MYVCVYIKYDLFIYEGLPFNFKKNYVYMKYNRRRLFHSNLRLS